MSLSRRTLLIFGNVVIREEDVQILNGNDWLNDTLISFYFEYLSERVYQDNPEILFLDPALTQVLKAQGIDISGILDGLQANEKDLVFFVLNDNDALNRHGGSHWSLLVFCRQDERFYHLDSMRSSDHHQRAIIFCEGLAGYFCPGTRIDYDLELECGQQINGYDCGIHVLCNADAVAEHFINSKDYPRTIRNFQALDRSVAEGKRAIVLDIINSLIEESEDE